MQNNEYLTFNVVEYWYQLWWSLLRSEDSIELTVSHGASEISFLLDVNVDGRVVITQWWRVDGRISSGGTHWR
jgi:hypothetical protein